MRAEASRSVGSKFLVSFSATYAAKKKNIHNNKDTRHTPSLVGGQESAGTVCASFREGVRRSATCL